MTNCGRRQARVLSTRWLQAGFRPEVLLSSPVRRAHETAGILATGWTELEIVDDCELCEMHNGQADGMTWSEYDAKYGRFNLMAEPSRPFAPGAESWNDVVARVRRCMEGFADRYTGQTVVVVTHSGFVIASMLELLSVQNVPTRATLDPWYTSITGWSRKENRWSLECFNDVAHLSNPTEFG